MLIHAKVLDVCCVCVCSRKGKKINDKKGKRKQKAPLVHTDTLQEEHEAKK